MAAKTAPEPKASHRQGRRREIAGILLLASGLFAGMSLVSLHAGGDPLMGPGGEAVADGLYAFAGLNAYLLVVGLLGAAVRCFRSRPIIDGLREGTGVCLLFVAVSALLYLPFAGDDLSLNGPGGLVGSWCGELVGSVIGPVGAALSAATTLVVALLLVTDVTMREAAVVLAWAARHTARGFVAGVTTAWRVARAAFPEKDDTGERGGRRDGADEESGEDAHDEIPIVAPIRAAADADDARDRDETTEPDAGPALAAGDGVPEPVEREESEGVRIGVPRTVSDAMAAERAERAAVAAVVAEVAAVERLPDEDEDAEGARAEASDDDDEPMVSIPSAVARPDAPVIIGPATVVRLRDAEAAAAGEGPSEEARASEEKRVAAAGPGFIKLGEGAFELPGTELLEYVPPTHHDTDKQGLYDMAERLEQAMSNYGVRGKVKEIHMGPVVTMYEFAPAPGTRTGKIANLEKDLAMALEAQAVRIVAPIPGKAVVGVEVPNRNRETVYLKEILQDGSFTTATGKLQIAMGKDIKGAPVSVNLAKMPHLLVAGTTGSGKSVAVNGMITSLLYNASPEDVRFIMVDPKMLELSIYEGIPHLLLPVVTDPKKANLALRWAVDEMERRYELLAKTGVRDIISYNAKIEGKSEGKSEGKLDKAGGKAAQDAKAHADKKIRVVITGADGVEQEVDLDADTEITVAEGSDSGGIVDVAAPSDEDLSDQAAAAQAAQEAAAEPKPTKLPYIVIVIDEFADLMMVAPKDVETSVARLAQKARAAGLHLILATQRPSVDVITGLIKANFPSRIALQVASKIDSRTILDTSGAETLLGNGDMLFSDRGTKLRRLHGAFLSDDEVHRVVDFLKKQAKPVYDMDILKPREEEGEEGGAPADDFHDDLYDQAISIVCETRQASVSYIQRRLQIGYNRAARMVERMEHDGIVGPTNGAKPRDVLAPPGEYLQQAG